jgi:DNA invertase Pin-like site-specific DNA recombinase
MKRAISYLRFSRGHQRKGRSENRQATGAAHYCERHGWALDASLYADRGVSGFRGANAATGALGDFLSAIKSGAVKPGDVLIVESLDRLSRQDIDEAYDLFRGILRTGVEVVTLDPERHYDKASLKSITGIIEPLVIMARANEESATKSGRSKDVWKAKRQAAAEKKRPVNHAHPAWLSAVRQDGKVVRFVANENRVAVVKRIFSLCIEGRGCIAIARLLNKEGVEPFGGRAWAESAIHRILRKRAVLGEYQPKQRAAKGGREAVGKAIQSYYPAVIDAQTFWRAQGIVDGRKRLNIRGREGKGTPNLLTGMAWDAKTGSPMLYKNTTAGKYLDSANAYAGKAPACGFRYEIFEESLLMILKEGITLESNDKDTAAANREALEAELGACEARLKRTQATMATADDPDVHASLAEVLAQQVQQRKALQAQLNEAKAEERSDPKEDLKATKSIILQYYEALEREKTLGGLMDGLKREAKKKPTPEMKELEAKIRGENWGDFRAQLKTKIRSLITEIWILVKAEGWRSKTAFVDIHFKDGGVRTFSIHVDPAGDVTNTPMDALDLKHYRSKRERLDKSNARLKQTWEEMGMKEAPNDA